jgi:raffinose/stachyose/melibiose transport system permease protein
MKLRKADIKNHLTFFGFIMPGIAAILLFVEIPFIMSVLYSFTKWNGLDRVPKFIGLRNYREMFQDTDMIKAFIFTFIFAFVFVIVVNAIALFLAVILDSNIRGKNFFRAAFYVPNIISLIVIGYMWRFIFSNAFDSIYQVTHWKLLGLSWLGDANIVFISLIIVSVWQAVGFYMIIYIAGLQTLPKELIEAAHVDGATGMKTFFKITLPLIMPSITVCIFYSLSNALKVFDVILSLTAGGPGKATASIALDIYQTAFNDNRFGYGAAKSVLLFVVILVITLIQVTAFKSKEVEA